MIKKDELTRIAEAKRLSLENAEKDYLLELLLFAIYSEFGDMLILKGGTCLYKMYSLNRFSQDLDFTLNKRRFDLERFLSKIMKSLNLLGIEGKVKDIERYKNEINVRLNFKGPLYDGRKESLSLIILNISLREKVLKEIRKELLTPMYREIPSFEIFVMNEQEILTEKVRAILTRNRARDVYDLWFLLKKGVNLDFNTINKKLKTYGTSFSSSYFDKKIEEKERFWETDLRGLLIGKLPSFSLIRKEILDMLRKATRSHKKLTS